MASCPHEIFDCNCNVANIEDVGRFMIDVTVKCAQCGVPFRFIGLPAGLDMNGASVSIDACEARLAIAPKDEVIPELEGGKPSGFSVRRVAGA